MARTDSLSNYLTDVAKAIKDKKGDDTPILASEFDNEITNLPSSGGDISEYIDDTIDIDGSTTINAWARCIKKLPPIYVNVANCQYLFNAFVGNELPELNFSVSITNCMDMFWQCINIKTVPTFDTSNVSIFDGMFNSCTHLETIPIFDFSKASSLNNICGNCTSLINVGGFINVGKAYTSNRAENYSAYTLDFHSSTNLTHESLLNIINNLYDIKANGCNNQKLRLSTQSMNLLSEDEIKIATDKGWNITT